MIRSGMLAIALLLVLSGTARADFISAHDLLSWCADHSPKNATNRARCVAYVMGVSDLMTALQRKDVIHNYCPSPDATADDQAAIVERYLRTHAEDANTAASPNVLIALRGAFPCAQGK